MIANEHVTVGYPMEMKNLGTKQSVFIEWEDIETWG